MNSCWQVLRTYLARARFWVFGLAYVGAAANTYLRSHESSVDRAVLINTSLGLSVLLASVIGFLAALHARRLLSGSAAHVVPGFALPHVIVGWFVCLAVWVVVPWGEAWAAGLHPVRIVALHSLAGTLSALVLLWPRTIFVAPAAALVVAWSANPRVWEFLRRLFSGEFPAATAGAIVLGVVAFPVAALLLLRVRDRAATFSDDLVLDRSHEIASRWKRPLLRMRDGAIEWRLARGSRLALLHWMIPCVISWREVGLLFALVIAVMTATGLAAGDADGALIVGVVASFVVLFIPLSAWRSRATALVSEWMRPVARRTLVRRFMGAMACSFAVWTLVAMLLTVLGYLPNIVAGRQALPFILWQHLLSLVAIAVLLYGITFATIRLRFWLPVSLGLVLLSTVGIGYAVGWFLYWWVRVLLLPQPSGAVVFGAMLTFFTLFGLLLGGLTYRRWLRMEIA